MSKQNYTPEMTEMAVAMYEELGNTGLPQIAEYMNQMARDAKLGGDTKTPNSVRSKLVREKVYVPSDKPIKQPKREGPSKKDLVVELVTLTGRQDEKDPFKGIEGATKGALKEVLAELKKVLED